MVVSHISALLNNYSGFRQEKPKEPLPVHSLFVLYGNFNIIRMDFAFRNFIFK